jgi:hypothetical protein
MTQLPIGTRIRFIKTLEEGPNEDHPGRLYARKNDEGIVTGHDCIEGHMVKWDYWPQADFGAIIDKEFVPIV